MFDDNASDDEIVEWLESEGALVWTGMDGEGERVLSINAKKMKEVAPELYEAMAEDIMYDIMGLYELGLVDVSYDEDLVAHFTITEEGKKMMDKYGFKEE